MILTIPMQLEEAKKEVKVNFSLISDNEFSMIKRNIYNNMGIVIENNSNFIWEQFVGSTNICGEFAWEHIKEIIPDSNCYLFFNPIECKNAYMFQNGSDLCEVIGETYNCEVYVTDFTGTYIICFNHEMVLSGCGKAIKWIENFKEKNNL